MKAHPLTSEYSSYGTFNELAENNRSQLRTLIEGLAAQQSQPGTVAQKVGDLYKMAMDSTKLNADGMAPIKGELEKISALNDRSQLSAFVAAMRRDGFGPFFGVYVGADEMNSSMNIAVAYQGGFSLGEREYYLENDENTKSIRNQYEAHVAKMFELTGLDAEQAKKAAADVMTVETRLAKSAKSAVELRDPHANYNKMSVAQLQKEVPGIDWDAYFSAIGLKGLQEINVGQIAALEETAALMEKEDLGVLKNYRLCKVLDAAAEYL